MAATPSARRILERALLLLIVWQADAARQVTLAGPDCNGNGVPDATDVAVGTSLDCNSNGVPDECDTDVAFAFHPISQLVDAPASAFAADVDGDGDLDVLSASFLDDRIAWYPNLGNGTFGAQQTITADAESAVAVVAADLDGDQDTDVLLAAFQGEIAWYENLDGVAGHFERHPISSQVPGAWSVFAADLDGDLDLDVLSASQNENKIAWYANTDGEGAFGPQRVISTQADIPRAVAAADLDGDSDADVLSASYGDNAVKWYENSDGRGTFGPAQVVSTAGAGTAHVVAGDVDGDADLDLVAASSIDGEVAWFEKLDGLDGFGPQELIFDDAITALWVQGADLDGDGDLDVVSASLGDDTIAWYENTDGAGSFGPRQIASTTVLEATSVIAADLDGDGDVDLVSTSQQADTVGWHENLGDDCDGNRVPDACQPDCDGNGRADACDLTAGVAADCNDNRVPDACDIAAATSLDCAGDGVPDECEPDCNGNAAADSCDIAGGTSLDCTGDGVPDECEPDCNGNAAADSCDIAGGTSLDCTGDGLPDECEPDCNGNAAADSCDIALGSSADCNSNGVPDECDAASPGPDCDADGVPDGCALETPFGRHVITTSADFPRSVFAVDLDLDGDADVLSASGIDDKVAWYENTDGAGTFGPQQIISNEADLPLSVVAADLSGDGLPDVLSAAFSDDEITWYPQTAAPGVFDPPRIITQQADGAQSVSAADLDGDGDPDVLAASFLDDRLAWYENLDGAGSFGAAHVISTVASGAFAVAAADVDGDLDLDVLSASFDDDTVAWYENTNGAGTFGPRRIVSAAADGAAFVVGADLDGDGDVDLAAAAQHGDQIAWYENLDGAGTFGPPRVLTTFSNGATSLSATDVDGDGALDLLSASFFDNTVAWHRNLGGATAFSPRRIVADAALGAWAVFATDVDGDGDTDVLSASQSDDTIAWYENRSGDCNGNGIPDGCDIAGGTSADCSSNGIPDTCEGDCNANGTADSCDVTQGASADCNGNGFPDECERDCNGNGVPDGCDVAAATSPDCDRNGVPDECDPDCNGNGVPDDCDLARMTSPDCNQNGVPDECDPDCNGNDVPDDCDLSQGTSADCDGNLVPDECDPDCNGDGTPNACDGDCNANAVPDGCDPDCNLNGAPDDCDVDSLSSADCNGTGIPDECETTCRVACDTDGDRCIDELDADPDDPLVCSDIEADGCDDCRSGSFNPGLDGPDTDGDGACNAGDCAVTDGTVWADPSPVRSLSLAAMTGATTLIAWQPPVHAGALVIFYDTLRSAQADDFVGSGAACVESDALDTTSLDPAVPAPGSVLHYLIRVENGCPGGTANMGTDSAGNPHVGIACP